MKENNNTIEEQIKNYKNYELDCLLLEKTPMAFGEFKKIKYYEEEDIF